MRKILTITTLLVLLTIAPARADLRWGPSVGVNLSTLKFKQHLFDVHHQVGFSAGALAEVMFPGLGFGMDLGLFYEERGAKLDLGDKKIWASQGYTSERMFIHNILIPVHLRFKWTRMGGLEEYFAPFVFAGPEFTIQAAHGHLKALQYSGGDVGLSVGLGAELQKRWQISAQYTWGMTYVCKTRLLTNESARARTWDLRVTYLF